MDWDLIVRALNRIGYRGPLSIEWEDSGMDRKWGAEEALEMVRGQDFAPSDATFEDGYRAAVVCDAILESAQSRRQMDVRY